MYANRNEFEIDVVNFTFLDGDVPRSTSYGVYVSQFLPLLECPVVMMTSQKRL